MAMNHGPKVSGGDFKGAGEDEQDDDGVWVISISLSFLLLFFFFFSLSLSPLSPSPSFTSSSFPTFPPSMSAISLPFYQCMYICLHVQT